MLRLLSKRRRGWAFALVTVEVLLGISLQHAIASGTYGIPLPPRSRPSGEGLFVSSRGFRATNEFYWRFLRRTGVPHKVVPIYRYRGIEVARILSSDPNLGWLAIHIFRHGGRTMIAIVPRHPLTPSSTHGKEPTLHR